MLNLEKSILQRERGCCMSQTSLKRMLSASLIILGLLSSFMSILSVSRVLVAFSSLEMTLGLMRRLTDFV